MVLRNGLIESIHYNLHSNCDDKANTLLLSILSPLNSNEWKYFIDLYWTKKRDNICLNCTFIDAGERIQQSSY